MKDFRSRGEETSVPKLGYRASTRGELRNYLSYRENLTLMALHETPCDRLLLFRASFMHYWSQKMERSLCKQNVPHFLPFFRIFLISRSFSAWRGSTPLISFIFFFSKAFNDSSEEGIAIPREFARNRETFPAYSILSQIITLESSRRYNGRSAMVVSHRGSSSLRAKVRFYKCS